MSNLSSDGTANVQVSSDNTTVKRLLLMNNPILNQGVKNKPAQVTVIHNTSTKPLSIREIEVLGPPSDVVIASPSGLICDSCSFKNTKRVVLTTGSPHFTHGNLTSIKTQQGLLEIVGAGLKTQDAVFVDLLANSINVHGEITTFTRVNKNSAGGFDVAPTTGKLLAAQGNLQLITGNTELSYQSGDIAITNASQTGSTLTIQGDITAGNVLIQTTSLNTNINLSHNMTTSGDISLVNTYQGRTVIPGGNIHVKSFGSLTLNENKLLTKSNVILEASNISIIPKEEYGDYSIQAGNIEISSENSLTMKGLLFADNIKVAADSVNNLGGELFARESLYVNGIRYIKNNHQGLLVGSNVALSSNNSIINGILKPWYCRPPLEAFRRSTHINSDTVQIGSGVGLVKSFISSCTGENIIQDWKLVERKASIFGFNISLNAPEIINSNPYIKQRNRYDKPEVKMEITDSNAVSISAENALVIQAKNSFKNGSGVVEVLNGSMSIDSPAINNQRYFIQAKTHTMHVKKPLPHICTPDGFWEWMVDMRYDDVMAPIDFPEMHDEVSDIKKNCAAIKGKTDIINKQYVSALSPVGRILVAGNITFSGNRFFNEASNIEIWGEMNGKLSEIKSLGLALNEKIVRKTVTHHSRRYCSRRVFGACIKRKTERWTTTSHKLVKDETKAQFPALFEINKANIHVANGKITTGNITFGK